MPSFLAATLLSVIFTFPVFAQELQIPFYDGIFVSDLAQQGHTKEKIFRKMQERLIKTESICANRAHMWSYDFMRFFEVESAKVFVFYTAKTSRASGERWWYHVAPVVNEEGKFYAMDKTFMDAPVSIDYWVNSFAKTRKGCYEIKNEDTDLIKNVFITMPFPTETKYGKHECYYKIVPSTVWFPIGIAFDLLKADQAGLPINFTLGDKIPSEEALQACIEASERDRSKPNDKVLQKAKERCEAYLGAKEPGAVKLPL